jgi:hypothetical protein
VTEGMDNITVPMAKNTNEKSNLSSTGGFFDNFCKKLFNLNVLMQIKFKYAKSVYVFKIFIAKIC